MAGDPTKPGITYVDREPPVGDWRRTVANDYSAYWDPRGNEQGVEGPNTNDVEEAIKWGRARSSIVLVRLGPTQDDYYSAGERRATRQLPEYGGTDMTPYAEWPPPWWPSDEPTA